MAANVPASLKAIQPFLKLAKEYDSRDPVVAYWSKRESYILYDKCPTNSQIMQYDIFHYCIFCVCALCFV